MERLFAVRATVEKREPVAEPLLLLDVLVVLLGVASFLLCREEREPDEGDVTPDQDGR